MLAIVKVDPVLADELRAHIAAEDGVTAASGRTGVPGTVVVAICRGLPYSIVMPKDLLLTVLRHYTSTFVTLSVSLLALLFRTRLLLLQLRPKK